jgi:hypothetical protein
MSDNLWRSAQESWQALVPEAQVGLRAAGVFAITLVAARAAGWLVGRRLRADHFDAAFRRPWAPTPAAGRSDPNPPTTPTPTRLVTGLVRWTVWAGGLWALAYLHGWTELTHQIEWVAGRVWALTAAVLTALYLSRLFTAALVEVVRVTPLRDKFDGWQQPAAVGREARPGGPAVVMGFVADGVMVLLVLLIAADLTGLALAGEALAAAWHLVLHLFTAGVALLIGWFAARSVRAQSAADAAPASTPAGFGSYTASIVLGAAALLAILLMAGNFPTYVGLVLLVVLGMLAWPAQRWLPDVYAGVLLRAQHVKEVRIDGGTYPVGPVGLLQTQLTYPEGVQTRGNRVVLDAHLGSPPSGPGPSPETGSPNGKPEPVDRA